MKDELKTADLTSLFAGIENLPELMAQSAARLKTFKESVIKQYAPEYPEAEFSDLFLMDLRRALKECRACKDCTGYPCKKETNPGFKYGTGYRADLQDMTVYYIDCPYKISHINKIKAEKQFSAAKIPNKYLGKTFADYKVTLENQNAVRAAHMAIEDGVGCYFFGGVGTGKTFLTAIIAQELLRRGKSVIFGDLSYLLNKMRASFTKDSENDIEEMMDTLKNCDVLILDDLGTEYVTEWATDKLFEIINFRYNKEKQTLITSNYGLGDLENRFNTPTKGAGGVTGTRLVSRISEMCKRVRLDGDDWRA